MKSAKTNWVGLAAAPFGPKRPKLEEARAVLAPWFARMREATDEGARDELVREAWECCASEGLIPLEWLSSDRRWLRVHEAFVRTDRDRTLDFSDTRSTTLIDHPPSLEACLAMASDAAGVLAAEELWRFVFTALQAWRPKRWATKHVVWRIDGGGPETSSTLMDVYSSPSQQLPYATLGLAGERAFAAALGKRAPSGWPLFIARLARASAYLDELAAAKVTRLAIDGKDAPMLDEDSPFARAAELFAMGYGVEWSARHEHLRLVAMPVR